MRSFFCLAMGLLAISAAFAYRNNRATLATVLGSVAGLMVLGFYFYCFIKQPEKDADVRVGLVIIASIAQLALLWLPHEINRKESER